MCNLENDKIQTIQVKIDSMITRLDSNFAVSRPGLVSDLEEIQDLLEGMKLSK